MCKCGLGDAFYRRFLTLVCMFVLKSLSQDLCNDVFNGIVWKIIRWLATSAAFCVVTVSSHGQKGWGQHAQIALCKCGLGDAFYRRFLTLVCTLVFKSLSQDLSNDVFNGIVRKIIRWLATSAAFCVVTVSFHRRKGWGQHAQSALRCDESFHVFRASQNLSIPS